VIKDNPLLDYAPPLNKPVDEDTAFMYCITLSYNGYKDWRFPTRPEFGDTGDVWFDGENFSNASGYWRWRVQPVRSKEDI
jgi:hypothetical protein